MNVRISVVTSCESVAKDVVVDYFEWERIVRVVRGLLVKKHLEVDLVGAVWTVEPGVPVE